MGFIFPAVKSTDFFKIQNIQTHTQKNVYAFSEFLKNACKNSRISWPCKTVGRSEFKGKLVPWSILSSSNSKSKTDHSVEVQLKINTSILPFLIIIMIAQISVNDKTWRKTEVAEEEGAPPAVGEWGFEPLALVPPQSALDFVFPLWWKPEWKCTPQCRSFQQDSYGLNRGDGKMKMMGKHTKKHKTIAHNPLEVHIKTSFRIRRHLERAAKGFVSLVCRIHTASLLHSFVLFYLLVFF